MARPGVRLLLTLGASSAPSANTGPPPPHSRRAATQLAIEQALDNLDESGVRAVETASDYSTFRGRAADVGYWVLTAPSLQKRVTEQATTWGRSVPRNRLLFLGGLETPHETSGRVQLPIEGAPFEDKGHRELLAWRYVVDQWRAAWCSEGGSGDDGAAAADAVTDCRFPDFIAKLDDDTFVLPDNMARYLALFDPDKPIFLGRKFHLGGEAGFQYASGGAGYVLTRAAAEIMAQHVPRCVEQFGLVPGVAGDVAVSQCLFSLGIPVRDTRDSAGRERFHAFSNTHHTAYVSAPSAWYEAWSYGPLHEGDDCCDRESSVTFHYMAGQMADFKWLK